MFNHSNILKDLKSTYEILETIVSSIDKTVRIVLVTENIEALNGNDGEYELSVCNSLWATVGFEITIKTVKYKIISIVPNVSITITGPSIPSVGYFDLYVPKFYHGTINATEQDLNEPVNNNLLSSDKLPMIWLHEPVEETHSFQEEEAIERYSNCDLFFMIDANFAGWSNEDHYTQAIKPMRQLFMSFYSAMKKSKYVNEDIMDTVRLNDLARFGRYSGYESKNKAIFSQYEMSGTSAKINIPFVRGTNVSCC